MENHEAFDAEVRVNASSSVTSLDKDESKNPGLTASFTPTETHNVTDNEDTPLLSKLHGPSGSKCSSSDDNEDRPPPTWSGERDHEGKPWRNTPSVYWLIPSFLVFTLAFGGTIVPRLDLILSLICKDYLADRATNDPSFSFMPVVFGEDNPQCRVPEVQALVSKFILYLNLVHGILSAITSPKFGVLSDRYGRTKIIGFMSFGMVMNEVVIIVTATYSDTVSINWLFLGYVFDGVCGSFIAAMAVTNAYVADCTKPTERAQTFAYIHGCLFTGIALGPILAGYLIKVTGELLTVFYVALGAHILFISFLTIAVPESLSKERQLAARQKSLNELAAHQSRIPEWNDLAAQALSGGGLFTPLKILWPTGPGTSRVRSNLVFLAAVDTTMFGVAMGSMTILIIYSEYVFGWGPYEQGAFMSIVNVCRVAVLVLLLPLIIRIVRGPASERNTARNSGSDGLDLFLIRMALTFEIIGYIGIASSTRGNMLIASAALAAVGGIGSPTLQSSLTKHVPSDRTGQLLGAVGLLHALAGIIAPTVFNLIYAKTVLKGYPQAVFVCLAGTFGIAFLLSLFVRPHVHFDDLKPPSRPGTADEVADDNVI